MRCSDGCAAPTTSSNNGLLSTLSLNGNGNSSSFTVGVGAHFYGQSSSTTCRFEMEICIESGGASCEQKVRLDEVPLKLTKKFICQIEEIQ